jgi:four helix bundle protein
MNSYRDLEIYKTAFELAKKVHFASLKLPQFELYEQGSQIRRSSKSIKDQMVEGYGRKRYKADLIKFLIYSHSSCDETSSQLEMLKELYPKIQDFFELSPEYENLGRKINRFIDYVENNWRT